jgi:hypothetical protein
MPSFGIGAEERLRSVARRVGDDVHLVGRRPLGAGEVAEAVPERRVRLLEGPEHHRHLAKGVARTPMVQDLAREPLQNDLERLEVDLLGLQVVQVEVRHLVGDDPAADPEVEATARELIEHAHFFDEPEWVVERHAVHARAQPDAPGPLGGGGEEDARHRCCP